MHTTAVLLASGQLWDEPLPGGTIHSTMDGTCTGTSTGDIVRARTGTSTIIVLVLVLVPVVHCRCSIHRIYCNMHHTLL